MFNICNKYNAYVYVVYIILKISFDINIFNIIKYYLR